MMRKLMLLAAATMLAGCAGPQSGGVRSFDMAYNGVSKDAKPKLCDNGNRCEIPLVKCKDPSKCELELIDDPINFEAGKKDIKVTWTLPAGYQFCPQMGDGIFLKDASSDQFELFDNKVFTCSGSISIIAKNDKQKLTNKYFIVYRNLSTPAKVFIIDPSMVNF